MKMVHSEESAVLTRQNRALSPRLEADVRRRQQLRRCLKMEKSSCEVFIIRKKREKSVLAPLRGGRELYGAVKKITAEQSYREKPALSPLESHLIGSPWRCRAFISRQRTSGAGGCRRSRRFGRRRGTGLDPCYTRKLTLVNGVDAIRRSRKKS